MSRAVTPDAVDQSVRFFVYDAAGAPAAVDATAAGLAAAYTRERDGRPLAAAVDVSPLSDLASAVAAHADGGLVVVDAATGEHRLDLPDAAYAAGADAVAVRVSADGYQIAAENVVLSSLAADAAAARVAAEAAGNYGIKGTINDLNPTASSFTLSDVFVQSSNLYRKRALEFLDGDFLGLTTRIVEYDGSTRRATIHPGLPNPPANGTSIRVFGIIL